MFIKDAWYMAAWAADIAEKPLGRTLLDEPLVFFRGADGRLGALEDRCCHRGFPLAHGRIAGDRLQCGYHGLEFDRSGQCVRVPGQEIVPPGAQVRSYPVVEQDEIAWVWMGDPAKADPARIISYPFNGSAPYRFDGAWPHKTATYHVNCNYQLILDNLLDLTHLGYVHSTTVGGNPDEHVQAEMKTTRTPTGVKFIRWLLNSVPPPTYVAGAGFTGRVDRWMDFEFIAPSTVLQFTGALAAGTGAYEEGRREGGFALRIFHGVSPETEHTAHYFWSAAHGMRMDDAEMTETVYRQIDRAFREDEFVLGEQYKRMLEFPDRTYVDINADGARIQARRTIERLIAEENAARAAE